MSGIDGFAEQGIPEGWDIGAGYVYGYRSWYIRTTYGLREEFPEYRLPALPDGDVYLHGQYGIPWLEKRLHAICRKKPWSLLSAPGPHSSTVPDASGNCGCGIWAYWDKNHPCVGRPYYPLVRSAEYGNERVAGMIRGSGHVIIGEKGFRCEDAEILALYVPLRRRPRNMLSELYGIPVLGSWFKFRRLCKRYEKENNGVWP